MFISIVHHTPVWVWGLLTALIALGLWQTRDHELTLPRVTVLPLVLVALSATGVLHTFGHLPIAFGSWAAGLGAALTVGRQFIEVRSARWSAPTGLLHVPGSWLPLTMIVGLFCIKYFAGASLALHPALAHDTVFAGLCSLAYGSFSGLFAARALSLRLLATRSAGLSAA
ncbi:MAG: DUF6622 family protein [Burkholderiales bacterium]